MIHSLSLLVSSVYSQHLLAQWMCSKADYRNAMTHEKEALTVFTSLVGISAWERERWFDSLNMHVILYLLFSLSLERITLRHAPAKSFCAPSPNRQWRWSALSDRPGLTAQSKQWRYSVPRSACVVWSHQLLWILLRQEESLWVNLHAPSALSVCFPQLTLCWSKWFWW